MPHINSNPLSRLVERLSVKTGKIISLITGFKSSGATAQKDVLAAQRSANVHFASMRELFTLFAVKEIPRIYEERAKEISGLLKSFRRIGKTFQAKAVKILVDQTVIDFTEGIKSGSGDVRRFLRMTQQQNIAEAKINQALARGMVEGTPKSIKSELLKVLEKKLIAGKVVTINRNGFVRKYDPAAYAEMVARSRMREAQSAATINTCVEHGVDYIRVSDHGDTDPECNQYAGRVFSISGTSKIPGVQPLAKYPPFHPNCIHTITPFIPGEEGTARYNRMLDSIEQANRAAESRVASDKDSELRQAKEKVKKAESERLREEQRVRVNRERREARRVKHDQKNG